MIYRVTFGFEGLGQGWSESHALKSNLTEPRDLIPVCRGIAQKRVTFLGREFAINLIRISRYSDDGATTRLKGSFPLKERFTNPIRLAEQAAEPASVALIARGSTAANLAPPPFTANLNQTFLGAPPDDAVNNGGEVDLGKSKLGVNYGQWAAAMIQGGFGWLISATIKDLGFSLITQTPSGTVEFVTDVVLAPELTAGRTYVGRIRRVNDGDSPLNGQVLVRAFGVSTLTTVEVIGLGLAQAGGRIRIYQPIQPFAQFATLEAQLLAGRHKRGRPFGFTPGRARKRIRG